jgi:hypothetical protein
MTRGTTREAPEHTEADLKSNRLGAACGGTDAHTGDAYSVNVFIRKLEEFLAASSNAGKSSSCSWSSRTGYGTVPRRRRPRGVL